MPRLRRVDCSEKGLTRRRCGRGFSYHNADGVQIDDPEIRARIEALAIPPAWEDVWICAHPNGHLQATGVDGAGRRQYIYHEQWREHRDREKYERMERFARALPGIRERIAADLKTDCLDYTCVLACAVRMLDHGFFRVGGERYAEQNRSYGLATLLEEHVTVERDAVVFDYPAKSGQQRVQRIVDPVICDMVRRLKRRRGGGPELLAYKQGRRWVDLRSSDVNDYLREISGEAFTAKDFRTWNATVLAAVGVAVASRSAATKTSRARAISRAVKEAAFYLGNTPTVCRASYIDPRVFDRFRAGVTIAGALAASR